MSPAAPPKAKKPPGGKPLDGAAVRRGLTAKSVQAIQQKVRDGKAATKAELELVERFVNENQPAEEDQAPTREDMVAQSMRNLQERLKRGETLRSHEMRLLDAFLEGNGPGSLRGDPEELKPGEPADILCNDQKALARVAGIHENTVGKWKREGLADPGAKPISLRAYFLLLRRRGKLSECKPTSAKGRDLQRWVFIGGGEASYNPDDPTHEPPADWSGERDRQSALKGLVERKTAQVDFETLERERLPIAKVQERLQRLAVEVRRILNGFVSIAGTVKGLTPEQRLVVADAIQAQIAKAQTELSTVQA